MATFVKWIPSVKIQLSCCLSDITSLFVKGTIMLHICKCTFRLAALVVRMNQIPETTGGLYSCYNCIEVIYCHIHSLDNTNLLLLYCLIVRLEIEGSGKTWRQDQRIRLRHVDTSGYLHSHDRKYTRIAGGQQEVSLSDILLFYLPSMRR